MRNRIAWLIPWALAAIILCVNVAAQKTQEALRRARSRVQGSSGKTAARAPVFRFSAVGIASGGAALHPNARNYGAGRGARLQIRRPADERSAGNMACVYSMYPGNRARDGNSPA
jgi:hypothetical protein